MRKRNLRGRRNNNAKKTNILKVFIILNCIIILLVTVLIYKVINKKIENEEIAKNRSERLNILFQELNRVSTEKIEVIDNEDVDKEDTVINIVTIGEILCEAGILEDSYSEESKTYSFNHMFSKVAKYTQNADITIGLLETNFLNDENYSGNIKYNSPKELASTLKTIGIDIINTASNHALDYGYKGLQSTIDNLKELGLEVVGTYKNKEDAEKILIKDVQGIKLAFLSYTYGTNSSYNAVEESTYCINIIEKEKMKNDIEKAKNQGADYVFVNVHWGDVDSSIQNSTQKELADFLFENGADFILGSHPASLQPMEVRTNKEEKNVFIAYSTGNFISASKYSNSNIEMILNIQITKSAKTGEIYLSKVTYTPVYLLDNGINSKDRYTLVDIQEELKSYQMGQSSISKETYKELQKAIVKIEELIGKE